TSRGHAHSTGWSAIGFSRLGMGSSERRQNHVLLERKDGSGMAMTRTELIIQLLKVIIGLAFGAYFVWWSLQVLDRLTPEYDGTAMVGRASQSTRRSHVGIVRNVSCDVSVPEGTCLVPEREYEPAGARPCG